MLKQQSAQFVSWLNDLMYKQMLICLKFIQSGVLLVILILIRDTGIHKIFQVSLNVIQERESKPYIRRFGRFFFQPQSTEQVQELFKAHISQCCSDIQFFKTFLLNM